MSLDGHLLQFYESDTFLMDVVSDFVSAGLRAHEPVIVIGREERRRTLVRTLISRNWHVDAMLRSGLLSLIDASELLSQIMRSGSFDEECATTLIAELLLKHQLTSRAGSVRIYGEMAGMLWEVDRFDDCHALEAIYGRLGINHRLMTLCSYRTQMTNNAMSEAAMEALCRCHSHVLPSEYCTQQTSLVTRVNHLHMMERQVHAYRSELLRQSRTASAQRREAIDLQDQMAALLRELCDDVNALAQLPELSDNANASLSLEKLQSHAEKLKALLGPCAELREQSS